MRRRWRFWLGSGVVAAAIGLSGLIVVRDWPVLALRHGWPTAEAREEGCQIIAARRSAGDVPALVRALGDPEWRVGMEAADALGAIGDRSTVPDLIAMTMEPGNENAREFALVALGRLGDQRAVPAVIAALRDPDVLARRNAANALGELRPAAAVEPLLEALADARFGYRGCAARSLGLIGDAHAFTALSDYLEAETDQYQAGGAAEGLGTLGDRRAVPQLLRFIRDRRFYVARPAIEALGRLRDPAAVDDLAALATDRSMQNDLRRDAVTALGQIGDPRALAIIAAPARSGAFGIQGTFARGRLGDSTARGDLLGLLHHDASWIRAEAATALAGCATSAELPALQSATHDSDPSVVRAARAATQRIAGAGQGGR